MIAANDNRPKHANDFDSLAERRAWMEARPERTKRVLAWPSLSRLARSNSKKAELLWKFTKLKEIPKTSIIENDEDMSTQCRREIRPSENELIAAAMRCHVVSAKSADGWKVILRNDTTMSFKDGEVRIGALLFRNGKLVSFGQTARGVPLKPIEQMRMPNGPKSSKRSTSDIRFLLSSDDPIAPGATFLAGVTNEKGKTSRPDIGEFEAAEELDRSRAIASLQAKLGPHFHVLEMAISDSTAYQIGVRFGYAGKTAERHGVALIDAALDEFQKIAA